MKKKTDYYFKCMQHTKQRPVTHHTTPPTGLGDYTHTPLIGICRTIFPSANGVHQTLWTGSNYSQLTMYWYIVPVHWAGIKPMTLDSQSQTQTTWLVDDCPFMFSTMWQIFLKALLLLDICHIHTIKINCTNNKWLTTMITGCSGWGYTTLWKHHHCYAKCYSPCNKFW